MTTTTDPTLATIVEKSPELLKAAGLEIVKGNWYWKLDGECDWLPKPFAERLLCWAMVKELWDKETTTTVLYLDEGFAVSHHGGYGRADTPIDALYAAYLAVRDKA